MNCIPRIAVLAAADSWYFRDLLRAAGDSYNMESVAFRSLNGFVSSNRSEFTTAETSLSREQFDAVLVRTMPAGSLEQIVFRMDALAGLEHAGQVVLNAPRAIEAAVDKYLCSARLAAAGLPVPDTWCGQTVAEALVAFDRLGSDVVLKPLFGAEGRGIIRLNDRDLAERAFGLLQNLQAAIYLQRYVEHEGFDTRLLVVGDDVFAMRRASALDWRTNVSRGAQPIRYEPTSGEIEFARRAASAVGAAIAGVDLLVGRDGSQYAIEVNAVPGWRALASVTGVDIARKVLDHTACVAKA